MYHKTTAVIALALGLLLAGPAGASTIEGRGTLEAVDRIGDTVTIENHVYQVLPESWIERDGQRIGLEQVPVPVKGHAVIVRFRGEDTDAGRVLEFLSIRVMKN